MRKLLVGFVMASVALALLGSAADAAEGLRRERSRQVRNRSVTYHVTTDCRRVYLRSNPGGSRTALVPQTKTVHGGSVTFVKTVRSRAAFKTFKVVARCNGRRGRTIGTVRLTVTRGLAHTGWPILPQVLLAAGLLGTGGLLLLLGRRRRFGQASSWAGAPGGRRA